MALEKNVLARAKNVMSGLGQRGLFVDVRMSSSCFRTICPGFTCSMCRHVDMLDACHMQHQEKLACEH